MTIKSLKECNSIYSRQVQFPFQDNVLSNCLLWIFVFTHFNLDFCSFLLVFFNHCSITVSRSSLPVRVVWWNHGQQIAIGDKYSVVETAEGIFSVIINPVELSDDGQWRVNVENQFGSASSECTLTLRVPKNYRKPRFVENLKAVLTKEGLVSFECKVVGYPTPLLRC